MPLSLLGAEVEKNVVWSCIVVLLICAPCPLLVLVPGPAVLVVE